jgi:hypothetical protein
MSRVISAAATRLLGASRAVRKAAYAFSLPASVLIKPMTGGTDADSSGEETGPMRFATHRIA